MGQIAGFQETLRRVAMTGEGFPEDQAGLAPNIDGDAHLSESEQDAPRQYYSGYLGTAQ